MIEYLYHNKDKIDPESYFAKVGCHNCEDITVIQIKKGKKVDEWLKEEKALCKICGCGEVLQSWRQFLAGRAMLTQLMELANKEEDIEGKKLGHYG